MTRFYAEDEKKFNYMVIYYLLYEGNRKARFCREMGLPRVEFEEWKREFAEKAKTYIYQLQSKFSGFDSGSNATVEQLINDCLNKLQTAIQLESDPSKIARTLDILHSFGEKDKTNGGRKRKRTMYDDITTNIDFNQEGGQDDGNEE